MTYESENIYNKYEIEPAYFSHRNNLPYLHGSIIKRLLSYLVEQDFYELDKARHEIELLIKYEKEKVIRESRYDPIVNDEDNIEAD